MNKPLPNISPIDYLIDGERTAIDEVQIAALEAIEEANSAIGCARVFSSYKIDSILARIQCELFDVGLCIGAGTSKAAKEGASCPIKVEHITRLQQETDNYSKDLISPSSSVLPGGSPGSSQLYLARSIVRRTERLVSKAARSHGISHDTVRYLNQLADFLFVIARVLNDMGDKDNLWVPSEKRMAP